MSRELLPLHAADLSSFAKSVRGELADRLERGAGLPSHVEMLNLLARAAGHRNVQALRAAPQPVPSPTPAPVRVAAPAKGPKHPDLSDTADRALRQFDERGVLMRWPTRFAVQRVVIWGLWLPFDTKRPYTEGEVNGVLNAHHAFGDHCLLRRELIEMKLLARTTGGAQYRKLAARPEPEVAAFLKALRARAAA